MPDEVFQKPKSPLMALFELFRSGNNSLALVAYGCVGGAALATGFETGWQRRVGYDTSPFHVQILFWVAGAAIFAAFCFNPNKFESLRYPLGWTDMDGPNEWLLLIGSVAVSCVVLVGTSELLALYGQ
jgi:hypothetical protein